MATLKSYCPKCKQKKLSRRCWAGEPHTFWLCFNRNCKLEITHPDRDSEISDYYGALGQLSRLEERATDYLLQNDRKVYKKGLNVFFEGPLGFVAYHRHKDLGYAIVHYWKADTVDESDEDVVSPVNERYLFKHPAAAGISYSGRSPQAFINNSSYRPTVLWTKCGGQQFRGKYNAALRKEITEWTSGFEAALPGLIEDARAAVKVWNDEEASIKSLVERVRVRVHDFRGPNDDTVKVVFDRLSIDECYLLDKILPNKLEVRILDTQTVIESTTEQADAVFKLLGVEGERVKVRYEHRVGKEMLKRVADALKVKEEVEA